MALHCWTISFLVGVGRIGFCHSSRQTRSVRFALAFGAFLKVPMLPHAIFIISLKDGDCAESSFWFP